jgi:hypothetical protein
MTSFYQRKELLFGMLHYLAKISSEIVGNLAGLVEYAPVTV